MSHDEEAMRMAREIFTEEELEEILIFEEENEIDLDLDDIFDDEDEEYDDESDED